VLRRVASGFRLARLPVNGSGTVEQRAQTALAQTLAASNSTTSSETGTGGTPPPEGTTTSSPTPDYGLPSPFFGKPFPV
jgi:hypothetical protein